MRKFCPLILLFLSLSIAAQSGGKRIVMWGSDPDCGFKSFQLQPDESLTCRVISTPRGPISAVEHNSIGLAIAFLESEDFILIAAQIKNGSGQTLNFDSDSWGAAHFEARDGFSKGIKPLRAEKAIPSRDIIRGISSDVVMDNSADSLIASISKASEVKEVRKPDGSRTRIIVIGQDKEAQQIADARGNSRRIYATEEQERIRKTALTQKWIAAQKDAKGLVYFRRVKKAALVVFAIPLGDTIYMFRLLRNP